MKTIKKAIVCLLLASVIFCELFSMNAYAVEPVPENIISLGDTSEYASKELPDDTTKIETEAAREPETATESIIKREDLIAYQEIIDKLNEEYGYSMVFDEALFTENSPYESPLNMTLEEFEMQLREDIEFNNSVIEESRVAIEALGDDVEWESVPYLGKSYELPANVTYMNSQMADVLYDDTISFYEDTISFQSGTLIEESNDTNSIETSNPIKTITSIQPKSDPSENVLFLMTSTIAIPSYWRYAAVNSFSYILLNNSYPKYVPTAFSHSLIDSLRTSAVTFTCNYYNSGGVLVGNGYSVYREFHASSDCITN